MKNKKKQDSVDDSIDLTVQDEVLDQLQDVPNPDHSNDGDQNDMNEAFSNLQAQIDSLKQELASAHDTLLRRTAEFENVKKRMMRERLQLIDEAKIEALRSFLPVNDDLQRTLNATKGQEILPAFLEGVHLVAEKFNSVLLNYGVELINESGVPFDVHIHDAMMRIPATDPAMEPNYVIQVLEAGYKLGDKIIRHAKVIVSE
jgi:molecular chaperone GrpE